MGLLAYLIDRGWKLEDALALGKMEAAIYQGLRLGAILAKGGDDA